MPAFVAWILGGLLSIAGSLVGRVLLALGIGYVSYTGVNVALDGLKAQAFTALNGLPPQILNVLGLLKIGTGLNILFSALVARLILNGLTSGTIKRMVLK